MPTKKEERLHLIKEMLLRGRFINVNKAAQDLSCSKRSVNRYLEELRATGYLFRYSNSQRKFISYPKAHEGQHDKGEAENLE